MESPAPGRRPERGQTAHPGGLFRSPWTVSWTIRAAGRTN